MRVHLIKERTIHEFVVKNAQSKISFEDWLNKIFVADWQVPQDIKQTFRTADFLGRGSSRVVFDIGGNKYRLICKYAFGDNEVHLFVSWIGAHKAYDDLCKNGEQYSISIYQ